MDFKSYKNLANLAGVFKGLYTMHGPFKTKEDAEAFAKSTGAKSAFYIESNYSLYIPKLEVPNETYSAFKEVAAKPKPEVGDGGTETPEPGNWVG